jgi:hypothetical protein
MPELAGRIRPAVATFVKKNNNKWITSGILN